MGLKYDAATIQDYQAIKATLDALANSVGAVLDGALRISERPSMEYPGRDEWGRPVNEVRDAIESLRLDLMARIEAARGLVVDDLHKANRVVSAE